MLMLLFVSTLFVPLNVVLQVRYGTNHKEQMYLLSELEAPAGRC